MDRKILFAVFSVLFVLLSPCSSRAVVFDRNDPAHVLSLNGDWQFQWLENAEGGIPENFYHPDFNAAGWDVITVPSNWEMKGYELPHYFTNRSDAKGLYRKTFRLPGSWHDKQVFIVFEGVSFGFDFYVNGQHAGSFESAFQRYEQDITDRLNREGKNLLALAVCKDHQQVAFDCNDAWSLSGIYRDVYLVAVPRTFISDYSVTSHLQNDLGSAVLDVKTMIRVVGQRNGKTRELILKAGVVDPDGQQVFSSSFPVPWIDYEYHPGPVSFRVEIGDPDLWNAEQPHLYELKLQLMSGGESLHQVTGRIGIREVHVEDNVLNINGKAVKLKGVCRHEIHPEVGRALREKHWRQDLELMKRGNINAIRTAHYPPHPVFLDLCDEYGFYVVCEVPFGFGEDLLFNPKYLGHLLGRAGRTVDRDKNHPSVVIWSVGNENPLTENVIKTAEYVKMLDPSRPILFPHNNFGGKRIGHLTGLPEFVDIYATHYPDDEKMEKMAKENTFRRPLLTTEFNHSLDEACGALADKWKVIEKYDCWAGGMIWLWADQGIFRNVNGRKVYNSYKSIHVLQGKPTAISADRWLNKDTVIDSHGQYGTDGIVFADRVPQTDYWLTRKIYSPVYIGRDELEVKPGRQQIDLEILNKYDFTNLDRLEIHWQLKENNSVLQQGDARAEAEPGKSALLRIPLDVPETIKEKFCFLVIEIRDYNGRTVYEHNVELTGGERQIWPALSSEIKPLDVSREMPSPVAFGSFSLVKRPDGLFDIKRGGKTFATGPCLHTGRPLTMAEQRMYGREDKTVWPCRAGMQLIRTAYRADQDRTIQLNYTYAYPENESNIIKLKVLMSPDREGGILCNYTIDTKRAEGYFNELGVSFRVNPEFHTARWVGMGPYETYPEKTELSERGWYEMDSAHIHFDGNRHRTDMVFLSGSSGNGLMMGGEKAQIAWRREEGVIRLSHNLVVAGLGTKFKMPKTTWQAGDIGIRKGKFILIPVIEKEIHPGLNMFLE